MRIFVYEFVLGGGWRSVDPQGAAPGSLAVEGEAMLGALAADFARAPGVEVTTLRDKRAPAFDGASSQLIFAETCVVDSAADEASSFRRLAAAADWTVVIAPELGGALLERSRWVLEAGGRLLGPGLELVAIASDKQLTCEHLANAGVPTPRGHALAAGERWPRDQTFPAVLKPRDGAGSQSVTLLVDAGSARSVTPLSTSARIEGYCPGLAASVAFLCGPKQRIALPSCRQRLATDGSFAYRGGAFPLPANLAQRAERLACRAIDTLRQPRGYLGVDLILGDDPSGAGDVVIEINPRLTTSYVGLRAAAETNLAEAMVDLAEGRPAAVSFARRAVEFDADGQVRMVSGDD